MADAKITQLSNNSTVDDADLVVIVDDVGGTPVTEKRTVDQLKQHIMTTYDVAISAPVALGNLGATETINWASGTHFTGTLDADVAITHSNEVSGQKITLVLSYSGAQRTITWTDVDVWAGGTEPTAPSTGETLIVTLAYIGTTCYGAGELFS